MPEDTHNAGQKHIPAALLKIWHYGSVKHRRHFFGRSGKQNCSLLPCLYDAAGRRAPFGFGRMIQPRGNIACFMLFGVISRPMRAKRARISASEAGSSTRSRPNASAIVSLVRSSAVGPSPPVRISRSARESARPTAATKAIVIIPDRSLKVAVNSKVTQLLGNILRVCIQNIAHQQLCADGKDLSRHDFAFLS